MCRSSYTQSETIYYSEKLETWESLVPIVLRLLIKKAIVVTKLKIAKSAGSRDVLPVECVGVPCLN